MPMEFDQRRFERYSLGVPNKSRTQHSPKLVECRLVHDGMYFTHRRGGERISGHVV